MEKVGGLIHFCDCGLWYTSIFEKLAENESVTSEAKEPYFLTKEILQGFPPAVKVVLTILHG